MNDDNPVNIPTNPVPTQETRGEPTPVNSTNTNNTDRKRSI